MHALLKLLQNTLPLAPLTAVDLFNQLPNRLRQRLPAAAIITIAKRFREPPVRMRFDFLRRHAPPAAALQHVLRI